MMKPGQNCWLTSGFTYLLLIVILGCSPRKDQSSSQELDSVDPGTQKATKISAPVPLAPGKRKVVSFVYHRFGDDRYPSTNTSIKDFRKQLAYLQENGFKVLTASEAIAFMISGDTSVTKAVCLTIDDGFKSFYQNGWPLLKEFGFKATLFVNTESVGWTDYLSWSQIKKMHNAGIEIGNHSHGHDYFLNYDRTHFENDLKKSMQLFQDSIGFSPDIHAYPYGEFTKDMAEVLQKSGFKAAFAQYSGVFHEKSLLWTIPRFPISGNFVSLAQFKEKANMNPLRLVQFNQYPAIDKKMPEYEIQVEDPDVNLNGARVFASGNVVDLEVDLQNSRIKIKAIEQLKKRRNLITVTASNNAGNEWYWHSQLFVLPEIPE